MTGANGRLWIHINTEPLGHLHPGNPSDPHDTTAVRSWNFKPTIPLLSHLFLSLSSLFFFFFFLPLSTILWLDCPDASQSKKKFLTIPHRAQRQGDGASWSYLVAMRGDTKAGKDKYVTTTERAVCLCRNLFATSSQNKIKKWVEKKQKNRVNLNSDSKSTVRTHGCLLHGLWRLQSVCAGEILVVFFFFFKKSPNQREE